VVSVSVQFALQVCYVYYFLLWSEQLALHAALSQLKNKTPHCSIYTTHESEQLQLRVDWAN